MFTKTFASSLVVGLAVSAAGLARGAGPDDKPVIAPYTLDVCPVSGKKLGAKGDPVVKVYDGREVRFCCAGCVGPFESDLTTSMKKVDEMIVKDELRYYPLNTCIISGEPLVEDGKDIATDVVVQNRLVRLCCGGCARKLKADPAKFIAMLDKAVADAQRKDYPLETCVISGGRLGSMGEPVEAVIGGRLVRFCCGGCVPKAKADPAKHLATVDKAWQAKGRFRRTQAAAQGH